MRHLVRCVVLVAACFAIAPRAVAQAMPTPDQLIDNLAAVDCTLPGVSDTGTFGGFLLDESSSQPVATMLVAQHGKLRVPMPCRNADVVNIVRLGPTALPALLRHVDDKRPTKLVVGQDLKQVVFGGQFFTGEYETRSRTWLLIGCDKDPLFCEMKRLIKTRYTVKIGDICFVLIGQVVNRDLYAVRYQPTAILFVNSPIATPALAARIRADWSGIDAEGLKKSLLDDLHATKIGGASDAERESRVLALVHSGALRRLRYYSPGTYASLPGGPPRARP